MADKVVRRRVVVRGRVQGVFFRDSVRARASSGGVAGWVMNRDDGAVEAVLEGPAAAVERVLGFMETGPPQAEVADVEVSEEDAGGLSGFIVR
jgi:acylphosphatase